MKIKFLKGIEKDPEPFRNALINLYDPSVDVETKFNLLTQVEGIGPFIAIQFIASIDKMKYCVISEDVMEAMRNLNLADAVPTKITTIDDYLYLNKICIKLFQYFENRFKFGLPIVHSFLYHYNKYFRKKGEWL